MAIFARRVVQRSLDALKPQICNPLDRGDLIGKLNARRRIAINTEWEVIIGAALADVSKIQYQRRTGTRNPDFLISSDVAGQQVEFLLDIVAPSDEGVSKANPADFFFEEFGRVASRFGIAGGFDIRIGDRIDGHFPKRKRRLLLPPKRDISRYIENEIRPLFNRISKSRESAHAATLSARGVDISIRYDPASRPFNSGGYGACESPFSLEENTLFRNLNEKASQLCDSGYIGIKGIMVADGGCGALKRGGRTCGTPWSRDEIVEHFLARHPHIDFVTSTHCNTVTRGGIHEELCHKVCWQRPFDQSKVRVIYPVLDAALRRLPHPKKSPANAWRELRAGDDISNGCNFGGCTWTPNRRLVYSSRTFLEIIAGAMTPDKFSLLLHNGMLNRGPLFTFFRSVHELNQKISSVSIHLNPDDDDDEIIFDLQEDRFRRDSHLRPLMPPWVDVPTVELVRFFARLAREVLLEERPRVSVGSLPVELQVSVRKNLYEGRTIVGAELLNEGERIRLAFGSPDPALSPYT